VTDLRPRHESDCVAAWTALLAEAATLGVRPPGWAADDPRLGDHAVHHLKIRALRMLIDEHRDCDRREADL
jgi:hypothetical protein